MTYTEDDIINSINPNKNKMWKYTITLAICTLFWQQTPDEISMFTNIHKNNKGFSSNDFIKGLKMAKCAMKSENIETLPDNLIYDAQKMVYKYRKQLVKILNKYEKTNIAIS